MNPEDLYSLSPREFEELIASIFSNEGYEINLTPATRDGGIDVIAERKNNLDLPDQWIIECKRYRKDHKVSVDSVRQLAGVRTILNSRNAALITTSEFTKDANLTAERAGIDLVDHKKLERWIKNYKETTRPKVEPRKTFQSVFISHSQKDIEFVKQLNSALRDKGVRTWFSHDDLEYGEKIHEAIFSAIDSFDRLIIVISENSMQSNWVSSELHRAMKRQRKEGRNVLFPISLVPYEKLKDWSCFDSDTGTDIATELREYLIPCITDLSDNSQFKMIVNKIAKALSVEK